MVLALGLRARSLLRGRRIFLMLPHRLRCGRMDPSVRKPTCRARHPSGALPRSRCTCLRKSGLTTASSSITTSALRGSAEVTTSVKLLHRPSSPSVSVESTRHARPSAGPYAEKRETGNRHRWAWICWRRQRSLRWSKLITTKAMAGISVLRGFPQCSWWRPPAETPHGIDFPRVSWSQRYGRCGWSWVSCPPVVVLAGVEGRGWCGGSAVVEDVSELG